MDSLNSKNNAVNKNINSTTRSKVITTINIILEESYQSGFCEMMKAENLYI
jgi:hypothetical protein